ncbi:MAG: tRNA (adenosine(37)-N6)-threonylcarbamoyltransferase complex dimerization subunit type 1 TsaB [Gemmatimonadaceae bacterium]|nr:tRNA (adenosine(37)-N6)-threonylcarbamoyltransferase complex dimerization subunit type 1 TsaB [Chitinophagaceae bacterium]
MKLLLTIDTATEKGSVSLSTQGILLAEKTSGNQMEHASWIHKAMEEMYAETGFHVRDTGIVAVVAGPGSYTGLRVGMATAKGLCFALGIPLITLNTLKVMAASAQRQLEKPEGYLLCPMLDARRNEVFTGIYDEKLEELVPPAPLVLEPDSLEKWTEKGKLVFFGNGSEKWKAICAYGGASFAYISYTSQDIATLAFQKETNSDFTDLAYAEPVYLKEFYNNQKKPVT